MSFGGFPRGRVNMSRSQERGEYLEGTSLATETEATAWRLAW
jgi:hypothetical protein